MAENISFSVGDELTADCLLEIFSYLSLDDMMQVKNVCRKWYQVSQHWFKQIQTVLFDYSLRGGWELRKNYSKRKIYAGFEFKKLISILHLYGHHIKYYQVYDCTMFGIRVLERDLMMFHLVPELCKNIEDVKILENGLLPPTAFKIMAMHWNKLERLYIKYLSRSVGNDFMELLRNNKQLETISFMFENNPECPVSDEFFSLFPTTIVAIHISFNSIHDEELTHFISASKNFTSLRSLKFLNLGYLSDAVVVAIANIESLTYLTLCHVDRYESHRTVNPIANLRGLKSLDLSHNHDLHEDSLIHIVESCIQLEELDIFNLNMLTDKGMTAIADLEELKILIINATDVTSESIINLCSSLGVLKCSCSKINNRDAIKFLKKATNLRLVDFTACRNLTQDMIQEAKKIANERKKNICITGDFGFLNSEEIDTLYFKWVEDFLFAPMYILLPNYIKDYIKELIFTKVTLSK